MRILVTGVCGQLGHDVVNEGVRRGHTVIGSDIQSSYSGIQDGSSVVTTHYEQIDITNKIAVENIR